MTSGGVFYDFDNLLDKIEHIFAISSANNIKTLGNDCLITLKWLRRIHTQTKNNLKIE